VGQGIRGWFKRLLSADEKRRKSCTKPPEGGGKSTAGLGKRALVNTGQNLAAATESVTWCECGGIGRTLARRGLGGVPSSRELGLKRGKRGQHDIRDS